MKNKTVAPLVANRKLRNGEVQNAKRRNGWVLFLHEHKQVNT